MEVPWSARKIMWSLGLDGAVVDAPSLRDVETKCAKDLASGKLNPRGKKKSWSI